MALLKEFVEYERANWARTVSYTSSLREVAEGLAEIIPDHRNVKLWETLTGHNACAVVMDAHATCPRFEDGAIYIPTDPDAQAKSFHLDRESMDKINDALKELRTRIVRYEHKREELFTLLADSELIRGLDPISRSIADALRMSLE
jgi:hypothetical protein